MLIKVEYTTKNNDYAKVEEMKRRSYQERFQISLDGDPDISFYTKSGLLIAKGYERIVIGGRGPYIEFSKSQIQHVNIFIPDHARHKLENEFSYYHEYRSKDKSYVKLYYQKACVSYADYKIGMWYIDPSLLKTEQFEELLLPLYPDPEVKTEKKEKTLFEVI